MADEPALVCAQGRGILGHVLAERVDGGTDLGQRVELGQASTSSSAIGRSCRRAVCTGSIVSPRARVHPAAAFGSTSSLKAVLTRWRLRPADALRGGSCPRPACGRGRRVAGGWQRPLVTAMRWSAPLSWRLPPRSRRCALRCAGGGGDRRDAGQCGRSLRVGGEALDAGDLGRSAWPRSARRKPGSASSCGASARDQRGELVLEVVDRARQLADAAQLVARDPRRGRVCSRAGAGGRRARSSQRRRGPAPPAGISSSGQRSCRCQRNRRLIAGALGDQVARGDRRSSRISQRRPVQAARSGSVSMPSSQRRAGDRERVDRRRTCPRSRGAPARRPSASAAPARPARRAPAGTAPARRRHAGSPRSPTPARSSTPRAQRSSSPNARARVAGTVSLPSSSTGPALVDRRQRVGALVRVRPDHDHLPPSLRRMLSGEADLRRTHLSRGDATLLSSHAGDPRAAAGWTAPAGSPDHVGPTSRAWERQLAARAAARGRWHGLTPAPRAGPRR